jgi:PAS domain S-box-containing protein
MKKRKRAVAKKKLAQASARQVHNGDGATSASASFELPKTSIDAAVRRYADLYDFAPVPYVSFDRVGRIEEINLAAVNLLGVARRSLIGSAFAAYVVRGNSHKFLRHLLSCRAAYRRVETELRLKTRAGEEVPVQLCSMPVSSSTKNGAFLYQTIITDLRERRQVEAALREAHAILEARVKERTAELHAANDELKREIKRRKGLEGQILEVSDREQQRLGQELHDGICQHLTAVAFMARAVALRSRDHRVFDAKDIEKIAELVNAAAADVRNLARGLHHIDVDAAGLVRALQNLVDREIWKIPCRLEVRRPFHIEDDEAAVHLYRIAREAVINANKHAEAREIVINLGRSRKGIALSVTDDGIGIAADVDRSKGMGFHIMNHRALSAGGRLEVESPKQGGTRVTCYLPASR